MDMILVIVAAFSGGVVSGLLGWTQSGEDFVARKFCATVLRSLLAAGGMALAYPFVQVMGLIPGVISAFLAGAGIDVLGHRLGGTVRGC